MTELRWAPCWPHEPCCLRGFMLLLFWRVWTVLSRDCAIPGLCNYLLEQVLCCYSGNLIYSGEASNLLNNKQAVLKASGISWGWSYSSSISLMNCNYHSVKASAEYWKFLTKCSAWHDRWFGFAYAYSCRDLLTSNEITGKYLRLSGATISSETRSWLVQWQIMWF